MISFQTSHVLKVGNSLGVIVPIEILRGLGIQRGDDVVFGVASGDVICIRKITDAEKLQIKLPTIKI